MCPQRVFITFLNQVYKKMGEHQKKIKKNNLRSKNYE